MNLLDRISAETPKFFKRVIAIAISLSVTATAILNMDTIAGYTNPEWLNTICHYVITAGLVATAIAKTTKVD